MNRCSNCNFELPDGAKFCPECGAPFTPEEESVAETAAPEIPEKNICEKCGLELPIGAKFCSVCGGKAIMGTSLVAPTKPVISAMPSTSGMMEAVSVQPPEIPVADIAGDFTPEIGEIPEASVAPVGNVPSEASVAPVASIDPMPSVSPMMESVSPVAESVDPMPSVSPMASVAPVASVASVPSAEPVSSDMNGSSPVSQPVTASQPVSASPIYPSVSGTGTATLEKPTETVGANSGVVSGTLPNAANSSTNAPSFAANTQTIDYSKLKPVKKMGIGAKIGIIAGSLVAAAAVAGGVFFATNKATFLSTILGKERYAVMVESDAVKSAAEKIDASAIADGVETVSALYASLGGTGSGDITGGIDGIGDIADMGFSAYSTVPMMYSTTPIDGTWAPADFDAASYVRSLNKQFLENYGVNAASVKMSMNVQFGNAVKELAGNVAMDDIEKLINSTEIAYDIVADETATNVKANINADGTTVDCKVLLTENGEMYVALPFVSDKALFIKLNAQATEQVETETVSLQLDKAELERVIGKCFETYLLNYRKAAITMDKDSITAAGVTVEGKKISAHFDSEALSKLVSELGDIIFKDSYLSGKLIEFYNEASGAQMTAEDYEKAIPDLTESVKGLELTITSVIDKNGNILGRAAKLANAQNSCDIYSIVRNDLAAFEMSSNNGDKITIKADIFSETDCDMNVAFTSSGKSMSFNVKFKGATTKQFCGKEQPVGTVVFSMNIPDDFEDQLGKDAFAAINGMTLTFTSDVSGDTAVNTIQVDAGNYGTYAINYELTAQDGTPEDAPNEAIDITSVLKDEILDDTLRSQLKDYIDEFGKAYNEKLMPFFEKYESIFGVMPVFTNPFDQKNIGGDLTLEEIIEYIDDDISMLEILAESVEDEDILKRIDALEVKYDDLSDKISDLDVDAEDYAEKLVRAENEYWDLYDELLEIQTEIDGGSDVPDPDLLYPAVNIDDISKMDYNELEDLMNDYNTVFDALKVIYESEAPNDAKLKELFDEADYASMDVEHDRDYFYETLKRGNLNINLLNAFRNSLKEYIPAVQALADAMDDRGLFD